MLSTCYSFNLRGYGYICLEGVWLRRVRHLIDITDRTPLSPLSRLCRVSSRASPLARARARRARSRAGPGRRALMRALR